LWAADPREIGGRGGAGREPITMALTDRPLHPRFAGEASGVALRETHDRATLDAIKALLDRYAVLVFRDQPFDDEEQTAFARRLDGELVMKVARTVIDATPRLTASGITDISNLDEHGAPLDPNDRRRMHSLGNRLWHSDSSFQDPPARYSMLSAKTVPDAGGETEYADMRAAYDALPAALRSQIAPLRAFHSILYSRETIGFTEFSDAERALFPGAEQPLVRVHPGSGRSSVYLASHASHVVGWPIPEGRLLLRELMERATRPDFVYRHTWRPGDFVIWDNRCTMHRGLGFDEATQHRDLRRVTTVDVPAATLATTR
jgi:alpha-ketoglutarate-dependent 2,4-dichlorophenoxyacetate dioxygenase